MLRYVTTMPPDATDQKKAFRYPFIAHEVLKSGCKFVLDYFFSLPEAEESDTETKSSTNAENLNVEALDNFIFSFLQSDECEDPVLAGYFASILGSFLQHRLRQLASYVFEVNPQVSVLLASRVSDPSIANFVGSLIQMTTQDEFEDDSTIANCFSEEREKLLKKLIDGFVGEKAATKAAIGTMLQQLFDNVWKAETFSKIVANACFGQQILLETILNSALTPIDGANNSLEERLSRRYDLQLLTDIVNLLVINKPQGPVLLGMMGDHQKEKKKRAAAAILKAQVEKENSWIGEFLVKVINSIEESLRKVA